MTRGSRDGWFATAVSAVRSRAFSFIVLGAWVSLLTIWVVPFTLLGQPESTVETIATQWWPFRIVYACALLSTAACTIDRARRDIRRARVSAPSPEPTPGRALTRLEAEDLDRVSAVLGAAGFSVAHSGGSLRAVRHRWAPMGGAVFHLSLLVLAIGLVVHALTFSSASFRLTESEAIGDEAAAQAAGVPADLFDAVRGLDLASVQPAFHEDVLLFKQLDATFTDATGTERTMSLARPLWTDPFTMVSIQDFGYTPTVEILDADGNVVDGSATPLTLFPPGTEDTFTSESTSLDVILKVYPDHAVVDGRDVSASYNLVDPRVLICVQPAGVETDVWTRKLVVLGEHVPVEGSQAELSVGVTALRTHGLFRITRSYGLPLIALALLGAVGGLAVRVLLVRVDVVAWQSAGGVDFDAWEDVAGRRAGVERVVRLMGDGVQ